LFISSSFLSNPKFASENFISSAIVTVLSTMLTESVAWNPTERAEPSSS